VAAAAAPGETAPATSPPAPAVVPPPASPADILGTAADLPARFGLGNLRPLCAGSVPGVPRLDAAAVDVAWEAFASPDTRAALNAHFDAVFGAASHLPQGACDSWRFPPAHPSSLLQVCSPGMDGPWRRCGEPPAGTGSVLVVSEIGGAPAP
jgi:hypothetical protein